VVFIAPAWVDHDCGLSAQILVKITVQFDRLFATSGIFSLNLLIKILEIVITFSFYKNELLFMFVG